MKLRELYETIRLDENYKGKVGKIKNEVPSCAPGTPGEAELNARVEWAVARLKSGQAILWYVNLFENYLRQNDEKYKGVFDSLLGGYQFTSFNDVQAKLDHWLASTYGDDQRIKEYLKKNVNTSTTLADVVANLNKIEKVIVAEQEAAQTASTPIEILPGDTPVLSLGAQGDWWHLPVNTHHPESQAMGHCGTCNIRSNNLLSLRDKVPRPHLTFEWDPSSYELYQMKGPKNSKPAKSYHHAILALLLSDIVTGLKNKSYMPATDFSIFDMSPDKVQMVAEQKPKLIIDQINKYPVVFLNAPDFIRANLEFRNAAIERLPGLAAIVQEDGTVDQTPDAWEEAIKTDPSTIIYAPTTVSFYKQRVAEALLSDNELTGYCSSKILGDLEIMTMVINTNPYLIESVPYSAPAFKQLAQIAIRKNHYVIGYINTDNMADDVKRDLWAMDPALIFHREFPVELFTTDELKPKYEDAVKQDKNKAGDIPDGIFTNKELKAIWEVAIQHPSIYLVERLPTGLFSDDELQKIYVNVLQNTHSLADMLQRMNLKLIPFEVIRKACIDAIEEYPSRITRLANINALPLTEIFDMDTIIKSWQVAIQEQLESNGTAYWAIHEIPEGLFSQQELTELVLPYFNSSDTNLLHSMSLAELVGPELARQRWLELIQEDPMLAFRLFRNQYQHKANIDVPITPEEIEPLVADYVSDNIDEPSVARQANHFNQVISTRLPEILKKMLKTYSREARLRDMSPEDKTFDICKYALEVNPANIRGINNQVRAILGPEAVEQLKEMVAPGYWEMMTWDDEDEND